MKKYKDLVEQTGDYDIQQALTKIEDDEMQDA